MKTLEERFLSGFIKKGESECWPWLRSTDKDGYGYIKENKKTTKVHRVAYRYYKGETGDKFVLHTCDNPSCVNPNHLWLGTAQDNMTDKVNKGRWKGGWPVRWGDSNPNCKITKLQRQGIAQHYKRGQASLYAAVYGVHKETILRIVREERDAVILPDICRFRDV